jgi:hypothetical protein
MDIAIILSGPNHLNHNFIVLYITTLPILVEFVVNITYPFIFL